MSQTYNIYCDESCHLEHDGIPVMVLGAVWCPLEKTKEISIRFREIKQRHGLKNKFELKWGKVSPAKLAYYKEVLDYFFDDDDICFRGIIIPDKSKLRHNDFKQSHDDWYYKMYYTLLQILLSPDEKYRIYLDKKDTCGSQKVKKLHEVLCSKICDFNTNIIERVQIVSSHESELVQLCDFISGILSYANRKLTTNSAKVALIERMRERSQLSLVRSTLMKAKKINLLLWEANAGVA